MINILSFIRSNSIGVFSEHEDMQRRDLFILKVASLLTIIVALSSSAYADHGIISVMLIALIMQLCAFLLFWYSAYSIKNVKFTIVFSNDKPEQLFTDGPYHFIRNPFYTSYILSYLSAFIFSLNPINIPFIALIYFVYIKAIKQEEKKF